MVYEFMRHSWHSIIINWHRPFGCWKILVVLSLFLLLNATLYCFSPADSFLESDTASYITSAKGLIETGSFSSESRLPIYPFVLAAILAITDHMEALVVALQALLLFTTGVVAMRIAETL